MDKRCTVCNHSQANEINLALLAGITLDNLKQQFGLSRSALQRHKQHLQRTIDQAEDRLRNNFLLSYLFQLNDYNAAAAATVAAARAEGNARLTLQAANAGTRIINIMAKFGVDLDHETIYRLITSRDYLQPGCLLPGDPHILAGPRRNLVRSLATACPETAPDDLFDPEDLAAYLQLAQESDANPPFPQAPQLEFPGFLIPLTNVLPNGPKPTAPHASPCLSDPSSLFPDPCLSEPEEMRDTCGTDAGQTTPLSENIEEFKRDIQEEKITGTNLALDPLPTALSVTNLDACPASNLLPTASCGLDFDAGPASDPLPTALCPLPTASRRTDLAAGAGIASPASHLTPDPWSPAPPGDVGPRDTLEDAQAAELAEYLENFSPYAEPAVDPAPDLSSPIPAPGCAGPKLKPPPPYDETARRADELFEISHGYKRGHPPKPIPYRRRDEDFRSNSIFGDPSKIYG